MKRAILILTAVASLASCKDDDKTVAPVDNGPMQYEISGPTELSLKWKDEAVLTYNFTHISGAKNNLSVSLTGLPAGVTASVSNTGAPTFSTSVTLSSAAMADGHYDVKITGDDNGTQKSFDLSLTVDNPDCADDIVGVVTANYTCTGKTEASEILRVSIAKEVVFKTIWFQDDNGVPWKVENIRAKLDCSNNTIVINVQEPIEGVSPTTSLPWYISGNGTFNGEKVTLNITAGDKPAGAGQPSRKGSCKIEFVK